MRVERFVGFCEIRFRNGDLIDLQRVMRRRVLYFLEKKSGVVNFLFLSTVIKDGILEQEIKMAKVEARVGCYFVY